MNSKIYNLKMSKKSEKSNYIFKDDSNFEGCSKNPYTKRKDEEINLNKEYNESYNDPQRPSIDTQKEEIKNNYFSENIENKKTSGGTDEIISEKSALNSHKNENEQNFNFISSQNLQPQSNYNLNNIQYIRVTETSKEKISNKSDFSNELNSINFSEENKNKKNEIELEKIKPKFKIENCNINILAFLIFAFKNIPNKKGRIPKYLKYFGVKGKHDKNSRDNYIDCIFNQCKNSLDTTIKNLLKNYAFCPNELNIKIKGGYPAYRKFCKKNLLEIYSFSFPKNVKENIKNDRKKNGFINQHNSSLIIQAINMEKRNKEKEIKKLDILFNKTTFYSILEAFLDDKTFIIIENTEIELEGFITYNACLNYKTKEEKDIIKVELKSKLNET